MSVGRTTIVVAHRLSTIRSANLITVIKLGKIVEIGTHEELIQNSDGVYTALVRVQIAEKEQEKGDEGDHEDISEDLKKESRRTMEFSDHLRFSARRLSDLHRSFSYKQVMDSFKKLQ